MTSMTPREPPEAPKGYRFRVATAADGALVDREFNRVFAMDRPLAGWHWKFPGSAHGWWGVIAETDQGEFAGHYAMTWYPMRRGERRVAQALDAFVAPEHQRRNLFARMGAFLLDGNARAGAVASFGLPNAAALPGHRKLGWKFPRPLRLYARPLRPLRAAARFASASGAFRVVDAAPGDAPLPMGAARVRDLAPLVESIRAWDASRGSLIPWDARSLSWRVLDRPDRTYDIIARGDHVCVLSSARLGELRASVLLAAIGATPRARRRACALAASVARASGHDVLVTASTARADRAAFLSSGFLPTPRRLPWIRFDHDADGATSATWGLSLLEVDLF